MVSQNNSREEPEDHADLQVIVKHCSCSMDSNPQTKHFLQFQCSSQEYKTVAREDDSSKSL